MTIRRASHRRQPLALAIALAVAANLAHGATITVTSPGDTDITDGSTCTLRQAIITMQDGVNIPPPMYMVEGNCRTYANTNPDGFGTNDTIVFGTQVPSNSTIGLSEVGLFVGGLATPLTIQGSGQTIDANNKSTVLAVVGSTLTVDSLTLSGGNAGPGPSQGGGVFAAYQATLTLNNCTISGNFANTGGGISAYQSTVTLSNSTFSNNFAVRGGGVYSSKSTVTLNNSTVSGNTALSGGGMVAYDHGTITLTDTFVSDNFAVYDGGGMLAGNLSSVTLTNGTVSGNLRQFRRPGRRRVCRRLWLNADPDQQHRLRQFRGIGYRRVKRLRGDPVQHNPRQQHRRRLHGRQLVCFPQPDL
jgi:CSLREA domain-containing protein